MTLTPPKTSRVLEYLLATLRLGARWSFHTLESFVFPVLEAMATAFPCRRPPSVEEIGGDAVLRFAPTAPADAARAIQVSSGLGLRARLVVEGPGAFSWATVAARTRGLLAFVHG